MHSSTLYRQLYAQQQHPVQTALCTAAPCTDSSTNSSSMPCAIALFTEYSDISLVEASTESFKKLQIRKVPFIESSVSHAPHPPPERLQCHMYPTHPQRGSRVTCTPPTPGEATVSHVPHPPLERLQCHMYPTHPWRGSSVTCTPPTPREAPVATAGLSVTVISLAETNLLLNP